VRLAALIGFLIALAALAPSVIVAIIIFGPY
jgi:hypothetical protein